MRDVLRYMVVTLDTTQLLRSALNEEAPWKAVVFGRRKKKGEMWNGPNKKNKQILTLCKERLTLFQGRHTWHDPVAEVGVERGRTPKGCCVFGRRRKKGKMWNGPNKTTKGPQLSTIGKEKLTFFQVSHTWHGPLADVGVERGSTIKGCCVWEEEEESVRCEMDQNKTTKEHNYQQLARKDVLVSKDVTLDTTQLLMSALNEEARSKAVVFGRRKKKV